MLVLTRRTDQKIVFPNLGVTLQVLKIRGNIVKIGIDAPADVPVLREEIADGQAPLPAVQAQPSQVEELLREVRHTLRNRLNAVTVALHLYKKQLEAGFEDEAGTTFHKIVEQFTVLDREFSGGQQQVADALSRTAARPARPSGRQALLVEDDRNECELLAGFLRLYDYNVVTANDGADALEYLSTHSRPDVVLLDMLMPRCDGPKTIGLIRQNPALRDLKVFGISGRSPEELGVETGPMGVNRWFHKPLNPEVLVQEMDRELTTADVA